MNIKNKLESINKEHYEILLGIGKAAQDINQKAYLVGGMVRDLLLGINNLDIDIVVENNASLLADKLVSSFSNCELSAKHDRFHTAKIIFTINGKKIPIDLASSREETYDNEKLAPLPNVRISDLKKDLIRRDFTINALAVSLLPNDFGEVVDLFNGLSDLNNKTIRILHEKSFIDDPTRMIRAIRFATKLNFKIEEKTNDLLNAAINSGVFNNLIEKIRGDRVKTEIRYLFNLSNINNAIEIFFKSGMYKLLDLNLNEINFKTEIKLNPSENQWLIVLGIIVHGFDNEKRKKLFKNLQLSNDEINLIENGLNVFYTIEKKCPNDKVEIYKLFKGLKNESILLVKILCDESNNLNINFLIEEYINFTSKVTLYVNGEDLIALGIPQGKQIGEILEKVLEEKIKNPTMSKEDEIRLIKKII